MTIPRTLACSVALAVAAGVGLVPTQALAQRGAARTGSGRVVVTTPSGSHEVVRPSGAFVVTTPSGSHVVVPPSNAFGHRRFGHRSFAPVVAYAPLGYGFAPYAPYFDSSLYYPPAEAYAPPAAYVMPPSGTLSVAPPSPTPGVVEFPTGRYELRGDGVTEPYRWVWIPNPPSAPPPPPGAAPPAAPAPPSSSDPGPARRTTVYRWIDAQGTVHLTDSLSRVPERYRSQVKRSDPA